MRRTCEITSNRSREYAIRYLKLISFLVYIMNLYTISIRIIPGNSESGEYLCVERSINITTCLSINPEILITYRIRINSSASFCNLFIGVHPERAFIATIEYFFYNNTILYFHMMLNFEALFDLVKIFNSG